MNYYHKHITVLAVTLTMGLSSCIKQKQPSKENTLARVGNDYLTLTQAKSDIPEVLYQQDSLKALSNYRLQWVKSKVRLLEADRLGLDEQSEVKERIQKAKEEVLEESLRKYVIASHKDELKVSDKEARAYYQEHKDKFILDEKFVQYRHLRARTIQDARAAKRDLLGGVSWNNVAHKYAVDDKAAIEEADQYQPISMAMSDISIMNRYLKIIGPEEISPIQRVNGFYHFVQITGSREKGDLPDLSWLISKIKHWLLLKKQRRNFSSYVKNLYLKAKSNNEVETFNVLPSTQTNQNSTYADTLKNNTNNE